MIEISNINKNEHSTCNSCSSPATYYIKFSTSRFSGGLGLYLCPVCLEELHSKLSKIQEVK